MSIIISVITLALFFSAFFSGVEIAFISSNKLKLEIDKKTGSIMSKILSIFSNNESNFIAAMLIGNNIALVVFSRFMTELLNPFIGKFSAFPILILLSQTIICTIIILVFAEFIPKALFRINPNYMLRFFSFPLLIFYFLLYPLVIVMIFLSKILLNFVFRLSAEQAKQVFSKVDLDEYLEGLTKDAEEEATDEVEMLKNALELANVKVRECMVPRTDLSLINMNASIEDLTEIFIKTKFSKLPVFKDHIDNVIGYVHSSDLFKSPKTIKSIMLPIPIVTESMPANELLNTFIEKNRGIALVVDEFGGTSGLVTIEDVTEEIVGEIVDEHDKDDTIEKKINDNEYLFSARVPIDYLNDKYQIKLPQSEEYETIAGCFLSLREDIPSKGEEIQIDNIILMIDEVDEKSIKSIRVFINL